MFNQDKQVLKQLVKEYLPHEILSSLKEIWNQQLNDLVDNQFSEQAKELSLVLWHLESFHHYGE
jgi:hypothetical protein